MTAMQRRFRRVLTALGEPFTVNGVPAGRGVVAVLPESQAGDYLTRAELDTFGRPLRIVYAPDDAVCAAGDNFGWDGLSLVIRRIVTLRFREAPVARILILA